jgi:hypothetical protein
MAAAAAAAADGTAACSNSGKNKKVDNNVHVIHERILLGWRRRRQHQGHLKNVAAWKSTHVNVKMPPILGLFQIAFIYSIKL